MESSVSNVKDIIQRMQRRNGLDPKELVDRNHIKADIAYYCKLDF